MEKERAIKYIRISVLIMVLGISAFTLEHFGIIGLSCVTYKYAGIICAGCGGTRMVQSILQLELYQAFRYNPIVFMSIPLYIFMYIKCGITYKKQGRITDKLANYILLYIVIIVLYSIIRNIPLFEILAPTKIN